MTRAAIVAGDPVTELGRAYVRVVEVWLETLFFLPARSPTPAEDRQRARIRQTLWRLERAYDDAVGDGGTPALARALGDLQKLVGDVRPAVLLWIDCVETLVQDAERRFGTEKGRGAYKAAQVKAALVHLLLDAELEIAGIPAYVQPLLFEVFAGATIDSIVFLLNRDRTLWKADSGETFEESSSFFGDLVRRLSNWLAGIVRNWVLGRAQLSPAVRAMVLRIEGDPAFRPAALVERATGIQTWLIENRTKVLGLLDLVTLGAKEAEALLEMSGEGKKAYVRDLVYVFLEDIGWDEVGGPVGFGIDLFIDMAIDGVVWILKKHAALPKSTRRLAAVS